MSQLNKLYRNFIILQEDERGYSSSNNKTLSGYSKIEAKGETCKISFYAQNLRHDEDEDYYILAICNKKDAKKIVNLGKLSVSEGGKAEVTKEYSIDNIGGLGIGYDKISGAAIAKMKNEIPIVIMCGFINGEQPSDSWKNYKVVKAAHDKGKHKHDDKKKDDKKKDDKKKCDKHREDEDRDIIIQEVNEIFKEENLEPIENYDEEIREEIELVQEEDENRSDSDYEEVIEERLTGEKVIKEDIIREEVIQEEISQNEVIQEDEIRRNPFENNNGDENPFYKNDLNIDENLSRGYIKNKFDEYEETIEDKEEFKVRGSVGEYFEGLANGFECCRGKYDEIKYCKWYKVPVSDLHEMCNMSNYNRYAVAYYPMLNYYPYIRQHRYFMLGYKCDKEGNLRYIVYGIPGKRNIDDQPYEGKTGFVTWVSDESRDGSGCWLMFYDFKNSTVVVPME
ncbi:MAG: hypothetical protein KIC47_06675 [Clostridium sp.]|nr:hypothetical protein [Clostridium sp.]